MNLIKTYRDRFGITQEALAKRLGVSPNTVARWERGDLTIRHPEMLRLALESLKKII